MTTGQDAARNYATDVLLRDGTSLHVRAIRSDDKVRLQEHFHSLGATSVYQRFLGFKTALTESDLRRLTEIDFYEHVALVATTSLESDEKFIGVGRYVRLPPGSDGVLRAEFALAVSDAWQGRGVGTALLEILAGIASRAGIERFESDIFSNNTSMLDVLAHIGFDVSTDSDGDEIRAWFPVRLTEGARHAADARAFAAAAKSVRALLEPRSVALVGASGRPNTIGAALLNNLRGHFRGPVFPINPNADEIDGQKCYPTAVSVGAAVDLGVIAVPAHAVLESVRDCAAAGARGVVVISAGFAEVSPEGREEQNRLRRFVRASGLRMVGPNCMGILNTDPAFALNATFAPTQAPAGNVAMLSQSGALGLAVLDYARELHVGISTFVSVGNKADVSGNDLLAYWKDDPRTDVIALYLESFGNPRRFARLAREVALRKPIVAVKSGRSAAGTRAASSHSASLACLDVGVDALFEQAGVIRTNTLEGMFDVVTLLATQGAPRGPRIGVVTNAGGPAILLADACEAQGLMLPELTAASLAQLRAILPANASVKNPVDMIAAASARQYEQTIAIVGADPNIDAVVAVYVPPLVTTTEEIAAAVARGAGAVPREKPVVTVFLACKGAPPILASGPRGALPSYAFPENAARALSAAFKYHRWRTRARGVVVHLTDEERSEARRIVHAALEARKEPHWLEPSEVRSLLAATRIGMAPFEVVAPEAATAAAKTLGYPVVAKAVASGLVHKTEAGGVALGLRSDTDVKNAVNKMRADLQARGFELDKVIVQREVSAGLEAIVGVVADPTFGPLIVAGLGGVQVELLKDVSFHLPPVSDVDAADMIDRLRLRPLFSGYRGSPPADRSALMTLIQRLSALVEEVPELQELDLNPVRVLPQGEGAIVVDARIRIAPPSLTYQ